MAGIRWTALEEDTLTALYGIADRETLKRSLPNRTWDAIKLRAGHLGLKFYDARRSHEYVQADLSPLLEDNVIAYYWMGFLGADGSFSNCRLKLTLAKRDQDHVRRFCEFIHCSNDRDQINDGYGVSVQDKAVVPELTKKFHFKKSKTYNPPNLSWMKDEHFLPFVIGFIDGDGSIKKQFGRNDAQCAIKVHRSWMDNLQEISNRICAMAGTSPNKARIGKHGYASLCFSNSIVLRYLKTKVLEMELPVLQRKWDQIDENFVSRIELSQQRLPKIKDMLDQGMTQKEIAAELDLSRALICGIVKKNNLKKVA